MNMPLISIIVSIYNGEKRLNQCIDSLVYQTYENIEIILVDKESTDTSKKIENLYQNQFPDKVRVYHIDYSENAAAGRNYGISVARGDYIAFCDADDWYELNAMEKIAEKIISDRPDIIVYDTYVKDVSGKVKRIDRCPRDKKIEAQIARSGYLSFWSRVIKKEIILNYGIVPTESYSDDISYIPAIMSCMKKVSILPMPLYNYVINDGISSNKLSVKMLGIFSSFDYLLEHSDQKYREAIAYVIATRLVFFYRSTLPYRNEAVKWLKTHAELFIDNKYLQNDVVVYRILGKMAKQIQKIPKIIYVSGFGRTWNDDELNNLLHTVFYDCSNASIITLNENNCNLDANCLVKEAYRNGNYEYVSHYFALKEIYKTGGFYIGEKIHFLTPMDRMLIESSVFSYIDDCNFCDAIWGAGIRHNVIRDLLETYEKVDFFEKKYMLLSDRIKIILSSLYDIHCNGNTIVKKDISVYDVELFVFSTRGIQQIAYYDFSDKYKDNGYTVLPVSLINKYINEVHILKSNKSNQIKNNLILDKEILESDAWKLAVKLKEWGNNNRIGMICKRVFKWSVRMYRKYNKK